MQFSPVLTTVGAQTCTTWRFVYVLIARLRCWLYPHIQFRLNFYTSAGYHCKLITTGWDCFRCQVTGDIQSNEEAYKLAWMGSGSHFCGLEPCVLLSASIVQTMNGRWVIDAQSKHWIAPNSCRQTKLWIGLNTQSCKQPNTSWVCLKNSSEFWFFLSWGIVSLITIFTGLDLQQALYVHLANWKMRRHFTLCMSVWLLQHWEQA
jgi:hypothetical protein